MQSIARDKARTRDEYMLLVALYATLDSSDVLDYESIADKTLEEYRSLPYYRSTPHAG